MITSKTKAYILFEEKMPNQNLSCAHEGFKNLGADVILLYKQSKINEIKDFGYDVVMCGYIQDVCMALNSIGIESPKAIDYPDCLKPFFKREINTCSLKNIRAASGSVFIKPVKHKLFTGLVFDDSEKSRRLIVDIPDDTEVYYSNTIEIISEHRAFILNGSILDVRRYTGDWSVAPDKAFVEEVVRSYKNPPAAYTADIGVLKDGTNILIEINDGFSFGSYGLRPEFYAQMLHARWNELVK